MASRSVIVGRGSRFALGMLAHSSSGQGRRVSTGIAVAVCRCGPPSAGAGLVDAVLGELLVQGVAVDAQAGGGLDLDAVAGLEDLLDQLALDLADDPVVQVVGGRAGGADALADQLDGQGAEVGAAAAMADRPGGRLAAELRRQVLDESARARAQDHRPLDVVLQLADVARPVVLAEQPHRLGVDPPHLAAVLLGVALEEEQRPAARCPRGARAAAAGRSAPR